MLKKYKILIALIALILLGIMVVISIWLFGIYKNKQENLVSEVERSLFNTVQSYYRSNEQANMGRNNHFNREGDVFIHEIKKIYPDIQQTKLQEIWDSLSNERRLRFEKRFKIRQNRIEKEGSKNDGMPPFMLQNIDFDKEDLANIDKLLDRSLHSKGITVHTKVDTLWVSDESPDIAHRRYEITDEGEIRTRPILINPDKNILLFTNIETSFFYVVKKMFLQILMSLILVLALISTFSYLLLTISKQNKMALLRRSFVNNMTHELKTPVTTVMAAIEAVQRYGAKDDKVKTAKYLEISHREMEHLSQLIERVLQLDMDGVSGLVLDKVRFDLIQLLSECMEMAKLGCQKPIEIDFSANKDSIFFVGDIAHIKNVLNNLLDNAIKYSHEEVRMVVKAEEYSDAIHIVVQDYGHGIAEKYVKDIFDMFFRVPVGNLHPVKGFGLGLSYVKLIVEKHGGRVEVESKLDEGSTFKIILPKL